ncbi:Sec63-domain-containing protein, partial [Rozella allomycis CSF55]
KYQPKTKESMQTYELFLNYVERVLGDQPRDVMRTAVDDVIGILKDEEMKEFDKKKQVEKVLEEELSGEEFAQLVSLGQKITDYSVNEEMDGDGIDEQIGVAVVFDEEEEEDELFEIREEEEDNDDDEEEMDEQIKIGEMEEDKGQMIEEDFISVHDIDAHWIQRQISGYYNDVVESQDVANRIYAILEQSKDSRVCENELVALLDYDKFDLVKLFTKNRTMIVWCVKLNKAANEEKAEIVKQMRGDHELEEILTRMNMNREQEKAFKTVERPSTPMDLDHGANEENVEQMGQVDLESLSFNEGGHLMTNKKCRLPETAFKKTKKGYEEIHIPAVKAQAASNEELIPIADLPGWTHKVFAGAKSLNRVQSKVYQTAFYSDENMLLCAPTSAGKTNVAMLTMLHEIGKHINFETGEIDTENFKIVYIAPMKALVQEMVNNFGNRLKEYGIKVAELTGDRQLTKAQIAETQIIVTTPEKWDVITRKNNDRSYTNLVRLIIIDEIHLLHDDRGPVLESIVARTIRMMEQRQELVRIVGLSATLPNYVDVARFLRVNVEKGLFYFDQSYRPCPLQQQFIGITERNARKRFQLMNEICYEKVMDQAGKNQVLVFVHSRRETAKTAKQIKQTAIDNNTIGYFIKEDGASREILKNQAESTKNLDLKELIPYGFAIHHAGMTRADRTMVEELFAEGHIQVLVSTSTLAWGVNLPAHSVIIKGTQLYNPEKGRFVELSPQDVLQMFGRAGRPQYDSFGEGIIITSQQELQYYLSLLNTQLPIESQFVSRLIDNLNAEIALGSVRNREEAVEWLGYTYLYVRMLKDPQTYNIDSKEEDLYLRKKRQELIHSAAMVLDKTSLIKYDKKSGNFSVTELGRIASHYYISYSSMEVYNQHLKPTMGDIDIFRVFSLSKEFKYIPIRPEEKLELNKLIEKVPIPIKESVEEASSKINVLLQSYISQLKLEGFAMVADMVYVTQSASRILRAMFEMCLRKGWSEVSKRLLDICKMVDRRQWYSMSPLRQFKTLGVDVLRNLERKDFPFERYFDLNAQELGEFIRVPKLGKQLYQMIHQFPRLELQAQILPITRSMLKIELTLTPNFDVISDRWLHSESKLVVSFDNLILPEKFSACSELLDLQLKPVSEVIEEIRMVEEVNREEVKGEDRMVEEKGEQESNSAIVESLTFHYLNPIQTQVYNSLVSNENIFIGAPSGSCKSTMAMIAISRMEENKKCLMICPNEGLMMNYYNKFYKLGRVNMMSGDVGIDLKMIQESRIILSTPEQWDVLSRRWKQRKQVQQIDLFIMQDLQFIGSKQGPIYEIIVSRMRYMTMQLEREMRFIGFSLPLANAKDVGEWIGATSIYNFHPSVRPDLLEIHIQTFNQVNFTSMVYSMVKPSFKFLKESASDGEKREKSKGEGEKSVVFIPSRKHLLIVAQEFINNCVMSGTHFNNETAQDENERLKLFEDGLLNECVKYGIGFVHESMKEKEKKEIIEMYEREEIRVLLISKDCCWIAPKCNKVVLMGTQYYEGREHRYVDYPITLILFMLGRSKDKCLFMCPFVRKEFYKKFLNEPLPIESHLNLNLHDYFNSEIVSKTIENKQDAVDCLTWTFLYRRLIKNPNYYNLNGTTNQHLSDHLSDLVESTLNDLSTAKCIEIENEFDISILNLGMIASFYNVHYVTLEMFNMSLTRNTKLKGLLEIISSASEFDDLFIRHHEEVILKKIYDRLPIKITNPIFNNPHCKANILLQSHFSRIKLPFDLENDQKLVLFKVIPLLQACVDVLSSNGWLNPCLSAMELSQMVIQAIWDKDSPLKQLPFINNQIIQNLNQIGVENIFDFMDLDDEKRNEICQLSNNEMSQVAQVVNRYPNIDVHYRIDDENDLISGFPVSISVHLERQDDDLFGPVIAPFYPKRKDENWWLVVGHLESKALYSIRRVAFEKQVDITLEFNLPEPGKYAFKLYLMCDA